MFKLDEKVSYTFSQTGKTVVGKIEFSGESVIIIRTTDNIKIKVSFKNFELIKKLSPVNELVA